MNCHLHLEPSTLYHKEFSGTNPGYDALQVDTFLDYVIQDYQTFEEYADSLESQISEYEVKFKVLNQEMSDVQAENANLKKRLSEIKSNDDASINNLDLLKKINLLEKALRKAGIDPQTVYDK